MPHFEVIINIPHNFCVQAKDEAEAEDKAMDAATGIGDNDAELDTIDDLDDKKDALIIEEYKDGYNGKIH